MNPNGYIHAMGPDPIRVFVGYDHVESVAFHTFCHSIWRRASDPVQIIPLIREQLINCNLHHREWDPKQSNDFTYTRWLVPLLCQYKGWALFFDCDMLMRGDISKLWMMRDYRYAVQCVQHVHDATGEPEEKFLGRTQTAYARKNWSSVMLFNNERCRTLTPEYVNHASGLELHQFNWIDDAEIGPLLPEWNHLVGVHPHMPDAECVHFTLGGPYFQGYEDCPFSDEWRKEYLHMAHCQQLDAKEDHPHAAAAGV